MSHAIPAELVMEPLHSGARIAHATGHDIIDCQSCGFKHALPLPDPATLERLGKVLNRPLPYFYAADDVLAAVIVAVDAATPAQRRRLLELLGIK